MWHNHVTVCAVKYQVPFVHNVYQYYDTVNMILLFYVDPPGCVCGFMSIARVHALTSNQRSGDREHFRRRQQLVIFPAITFTCTGEVVKWIVAGRHRNTIDEEFQLQLWKKLENETATVYQRVSQTTAISVEYEDEDDVYEISVDIYWF